LKKNKENIVKGSKLIQSKRQAAASGSYPIAKKSTIIGDLSLAGKISHTSN
jgi:hypothetical protein